MKEIIHYYDVKKKKQMWVRETILLAKILSMVTQNTLICTFQGPNRKVARLAPSHPSSYTLYLLTNLANCHVHVKGTMHLSNLLQPS